MDSYLHSYRTSPFSLAAGTDSLAYSYRRSPYSTISRSRELAYSKSTGNLLSPSGDSEKMASNRGIDIHNGSGFWPLRGPSRPITIDGVRCHLKEIYLEQLSILSKLWSTLRHDGRGLRGDLAAPFIHSAEKLLIKNDEGRIVRDFGNEILKVNSTATRRMRVSGEFGSGKSTLLHDLLLTWCSDDSELSYQFPILLHLRSEYAYGRRTIEDVLQTLLPTAELKFVMRILNDRNTRSQILFLVDDCEKYSQAQMGTRSRVNRDYENGDTRPSPYPLDMNRLLKGLYLPESMVVSTGTKTQEQDSSKGKSVNYVVYGLDEGVGEEFRSANPLRQTLTSILDGASKTDPRDVLYAGTEKTVTELLARMALPTHMSYEECIKTLGLFSLMSCQDYLPPLTFDSNHVLERKKHSLQRDDSFKDDADDVLRCAIEAGLLVSPGSGVLVTATVNTDSHAAPIKRYDYVLAFPHQAFALYLAARTFVSLNLYIDWTRIGQRHLSGNGHRDGAESLLVQNERYFLYFLTGIDPGYAHDLISRGARRENGVDMAFCLPWMVAEAATKEVRPISAYADEHFAVIGVGEISDMIVLNKLAIYYRSAQERALDFQSVLFTDPYDYEGTPITFLRFRHCNITDNFFRFSSGRLFDSLTGVEMSHCRFYDTSALEAFVIRLTTIAGKLTCLKINNCQQLAESIEFMRVISSKLFNLHTLQISDVEANEKSEKAAMALAEGLEKQNAIKRFLLNRNDVADILFLPIINTLELEELDLSQCRFTNEGRAWLRFVDDLKGNVYSPLKQSMINLRADDNESLGDTRGLAAALESCNRLKSISMKNCFRSAVQGERFREAIRKNPNANGLYRDVSI